MKEHTPGPWKHVPINRLGERVRDEIVGPGGFIVAVDVGLEADAVLAAAAPALAEQAQFLLDRLRELESDLLDDEVARQYMGHVLPAISRLQATVTAARGEA